MLADHAVDAREVDALARFARFHDVCVDIIDVIEPCRSYTFRATCICCGHSLELDDLSHDVAHVLFGILKSESADAAERSITRLAERLRTTRERVH